MRGLPRWILLGAWALLVSAGCGTRPMAPWDTGTPGWTVREAPAAWRPGSGPTEWTGELLLATHSGGARLVQFSKQGVPLVVARSGPDGWDLGSSLRRATRSGKGTAPPGILWFRVDAWPPRRALDGGWSLAVEPDGRWILSQARTGERLEVAP
jgi:hypothetical protein